MDLKFWKKSKVKEDSFTIKVIILAVFFGFSAGVVGQMVSHVYLDPYLTPNNYLTNVNQNDSVPELRKVKRFLGTQQDIVVEEINKKVILSLAGLYLKKANNEDIINRIYREDEMLANAFVLTSDGWLVTNSDVFTKYNENKVIVVLGARTYEVVRTVTDPLTNVVFIKIEAKNLPVVTLGDWQEASLGQTVLVLNSSGQSVLTNIESLNYKNQNSAQDLIRSSEEFYNFILIKDSLDETFQGAVILNLGGEVMGILDEIEKGNFKMAIPTNYFSNVITSVLRRGEISRPALGVSYVDLSESNAMGHTKGALIYANPSRTSPAFQAGLEEGDIILKVDDIPVDQRSDLTQLIQDYRVGDEVELLILREGQERTVEVFLGQVE